MSKYCNVCFVRLHSEHELRSHLTSKKHIKKLQYKELKKKIMQHSIFVSPIPKSVVPRELAEFFLQFGAINRYKVGRNHAIIEFTSRGPVEYLLENPIIMKETMLCIERRMEFSRQKKTYPKSSVEEPKATDFEVVKCIIEKEITFDRQLFAFVDAVVLNDMENEARYGSICTDLDHIFAPVFPNCRTYRFGSTQTGLGFKECDLDIYMDIGAPIFEAKNALPYCWTMQKVFKKVKVVMYKMKNVFSNIIPIPKAKTPIIKFCHVPTMISCDISFKHGFGLYNSLLIKKYISLDVRLRPFVLLIKYWARECKVAGTRRMSNYALIMMIIFYFQQPKPGILPPLIELQKNCEPKIINGCQVNFNENRILPAITNNDSIPQLLRDFFEFYATFDFKTNIICPFDGIIHTKQEFKEIESLPSYMAQYREMAKSEDLKLNISTPVCMQDPIELYRNVLAYTLQKDIELFQVLCEVSAEICAQAVTNNYTNLLLPLLTATPKSNNDFKFVINMKPYLKLEPNPTGSSDKYKDNWFSTVFNIIKDIFEKVYRLKVKIFLADKEIKQEKFEILSDVYTKEHQQFLICCTGNECVWINRKCRSYNLDPKLSALEKEVIITEQICLENTKTDSLIKLNINFTCKFDIKEDPPQVQLILVNKSREEKVFSQFFRVLSARTPKIVDKTLIHMWKEQKRPRE